MSLVWQGIVVEATEYQPNLLYLRRVQRLCLSIILSPRDKHKVMPRHVRCRPLPVNGVILRLVGAFWDIHLVGCLQVELVGLAIASHTQGDSIKALQVQIQHLQRVHACEQMGSAALQSCHLSCTRNTI